MRMLLVIFVVVYSVAFGQNVVEEQKNSVEPTPGSTYGADTLFKKMEAEDLQFAPSSKKSKSAIRSEQAIPMEREADKAEMSAQSAVQTFSTVKSSASQNRSQRSPSPQAQQKMDETVDQLELLAPGSFEFHFFSYQAGNYNVGLVDHLNKAEALKPNNSDVHLQKAAYHFILGEETQTLQYLEKLQASKRLSAEVINYGKDILLSVPTNGVLITHGVDDTYGALYHLLKNKVRTDVTLISLDLMQSDQYRKNLKEKGFKLPENSVIDVTYLTKFCAMNASKKMSLSLTFPKEYLAGMTDRLFVTGLVFEYHTESGFDNFQRNDELWKTILDKTASRKVFSDKGRQLSANYLPMLLMLSEVYGELNDQASKKAVDEEIDRIAVQSNKYELVRQLKSSY